MAEKRMISKKIIDTDMFLDMPISTRLLYYELNWRADDDGFVSSPKKITKMIGCSDDDLRLLTAKQFIFPFDSGVCVIKDWRTHNYIAKDRYHQTQYLDEKAELSVTENGSYTRCIQDVSNLSTEIRLDKIRLDKISVVTPDEPATHTTKFIPPTLEEIKAYCVERKNSVDDERFLDFYSSKGWMIGKNKMKDWKAAVRTWEKGSNPVQAPKPTKPTTYDIDEYENSDVFGSFKR